MKYCHNCHHFTAGQPLYCDHCGRSYDVKLCPHRHANLRSAMHCSQCGSPDLSTPQPHLPFWFAPVVVVLAFMPGLTLLLMTALFAMAAINALLHSPEQLPGLWMPGIGIVGLWIAYMPLPQLIRTGISRMWQRRSAGQANNDQEQEIRN